MRYAIVAAADAGHVFTSEEVHRRGADAGYTFPDAGLHHLKGFTDPVPLWELVVPPAGAT